eukprot:CAMPEP_0184675460 /NCGR_PEP_ID=MMETSP0308-20130426/87798_1 /TAXON_ID=38269 /ORGANISM="Gloeochaete witrockiana, Strain SAG 46.84" /LENGTH=77 /DNA_ID=CAMNT_0027123163 /DNA_START=409 /DNA_END=642 /DNA_ORIENTATION=+
MRDHHLHAGQPPSHARLLLIRFVCLERPVTQSTRVAKRLHLLINEELGELADLQKKYQKSQDVHMYDDEVPVRIIGP